MNARAPDFDYGSLNEKQLEAARCTEGPLLVLAGAGSGKTTALIARVARIIENGVNPHEILAITFTNKAANELKERLSRLLGPHGEQVWASTFHSMCVRFLRREIPALGYASGFSIYDADDSKRLIKNIMRALGIDEKAMTPAAVLSAISRAKSEAVSPKTYAQRAGDMFEEKAALCYEGYEETLKKAGALDFDDLLLKTAQLLRENPRVTERWKSRFRYVLVDEYQDTNRLQFLIVAALSSGCGNLCVVGDDDQSIYRFRGAVVENILQFERHFSGAKVIRLEENYRSTGAILAAANAVIAHNRSRKGKTLWTANPPGEKVGFYRADNDEDEARFVADVIIEECDRGRAYGDFCVLYRVNALSARVERALRLSGIPYRVVGGTRFFDRAEVRDMMAYLHILRNPHDDLRLTRVINKPPRDIGERTAEALRETAAAEGRSVFDIMRDIRRYNFTKKKTEAIEGFMALYDRLSRALSTSGLGEFYDGLLAETGYLAMLAEEGETSRTRAENVLELKSSLVQYSLSADEPTLAGFLDEAALLTDIDKYDEQADAAVLMTIHSAKGLEFPVVFLVGAEEKIIPGARSIGIAEEIEEERRLCYVAVTRAREKLYVTCARERMLYGQTGYNPVSRFVKEMELY
ncbi:MAG: UvrD-helicase domain-containing protein [Oscillospiraceae bacterium]|jgi:DNA helicase-2/ATP-dependent DNA helicase PcrA|nr:UvrD-helicase domain-containing protein [Oscillospiraceae bacterium]